MEPNKEPTMSGEITFKGELHTIPAGASLVLKVDRPITHEQATRIREHCTRALGAEQKVLVLGPEVSPVVARASRTFTAENAAGATVHDIDTKEKLPAVISVDIDSAEVKMAYQPLRLVGDELETFTRRYAAIHPIYGGKRAPQLFHCYGRKD